MRSLILASIFIPSVSFAACPIISGEFKSCIFKDGGASDRGPLSITQSVQNKYMNYIIKNNDGEQLLRADGRSKYETIKDPESGTTLTTSSVITCSDVFLNTKMEMKLDGMLVGYVKTSYSKVGNQLMVDSKHFDGDEEELVQEICE